MRKNTFKVMLAELRGRLEAIAGRNLSLVERFNSSLSEIGAFLSEVRRAVQRVPFKELSDEVYFFKFEMSEYLSLQVFQVALFNLEKGKPVGVAELLREYYLEELRFISRFFKQHAFLYEYYRSGFTELDEVLFVRGAEASSPFLLGSPALDVAYSTSGDYLFGKFMAYEALRDYILLELGKLDNGVALAVGVSGARPGGGKKWFDWSGEVINVVELGYALWLSGQIGSGKAGLQEIFRWLEESFGLDIGIPANRFREIKRRKRLSRTHFLDLCISALTDYMDQEDAFHPKGNGGLN